MNDRVLIDHLVVAADSLAQGQAWCERTLGVVPGPGGEHTFMGTHNRLLRIATVDFPRAYFEIIARNPAAEGPQPGRRRWFDLDDAPLQQVVRDSGPRLVHWVVQVPDIRAACSALAACGVDRGEPVLASRMTDRGLLEWQITIRPDGQRLFDGCLPTLIQWGQRHPAASMPDSAVALQGLAVTHPQADDLRAALQAIGLEDVPVKQGPANLCASLHTPKGTVRLESMGL